jgi:hypothetical protein
VLAQVPADVHKYGPIEGLPALREALLKKCRERNGIEGKEIHITCGGNQGSPPHLTVFSSSHADHPHARPSCVERSRESSLAVSPLRVHFWLFVWGDQRS